jgi:hypothetical protein
MLVIIKSMERNIYKIGKELFITSDEEIKEGDWFITIRPDFIGKPSKCLRIDETSVISQLKGSNNPNHTQYTEFEFAKKIILTTDQDLIKDGVQAIDDEFLEWFVKNPNCEKVEVESYNIDKEWDKVHTQFNPIYPKKTKYKIIIPKEEPKQTDEKGNPLTYWGGLEEPKQQRMYSEEDMIEFHKWAFQKNRIEESDKTTKELLSEWFEQFKKK